MQRWRGGEVERCIGSAVQRSRDLKFRDAEIKDAEVCKEAQVQSKEQSSRGVEVERSSDLLDVEMSRGLEV